MRLRPTLEEILRTPIPELKSPNHPVNDVVNSVYFNVWNEQAISGLMEQSKKHAVAEREVIEINEASRANGVPSSVLRKELSVSERDDTTQVSSTLADVRKTDILRAIHSVKAEASRLDNKTEILNKSRNVEFFGPVRNHRSFVHENLHDQTTLSASLDASHTVKKLEEQSKSLSNVPVATKRKSDEQGGHLPSPVAPPEDFQGPEVFDIGDLSYKEQKAQAKLTAKLETQAAASRKKRKCCCRVTKKGRACCEKRTTHNRKRSETSDGCD